MLVLGVIPARYQSTRFPGKALAPLGDKSMLEEVWRRASAAPQLDRVIIALLQNKFDGTEGCDDASIQSLSESLSKGLGLGSAEIAHVARQLRNTHYKRNWPRIFSRTEIGLPDINDIKI